MMFSRRVCVIFDDVDQVFVGPRRFQSRPDYPGKIIFTREQNDRRRLTRFRIGGATATPCHPGDRVHREQAFADTRFPHH